MPDPVDSLAQYIATDLGLGTVGENVFEYQTPDSSDGTVDTCITVRGTPGMPAALTQGDDTDFPGFVIVSRALDAQTALDRLKTISEALHGLCETDLHGTHFKLISATGSGPMPLGRDERQRNVFSRAFSSMVRGHTR